MSHGWIPPTRREGAEIRAIKVKVDKSYEVAKADFLIYWLRSLDMSGEDTPGDESYFHLILGRLLDCPDPLPKEYRTLGAKTYGEAAWSLLFFDMNTSPNHAASRLLA